MVLIVISCGNNPTNKNTHKERLVSRTDKLQIHKKDTAIIVGANRVETYLPLLRGKRIGVVANQTSVIFKNATTIDDTPLKKASYVHLVDSLISLRIDIKKVFAPEHGFRGKADAGEHVKDGIDTKTALPLLSLHGKHKKPTQEQLAGLDIMIFDIQDVGARFYTYISTLHFVMEACAEASIPLLILDRPNPNGHYVDGPIMEKEHMSFLGKHPIPIVHGMTIGEYAQMINREQWLKDGIQCELNIIDIENYTHDTPYSLPIKPSPNLPNDVAINLYPSICFFEQTPVSLGRGTEIQFQVLGTPNFHLKRHSFSFTPMPNEGSKYPKHKGKECWGEDLRQTERLSEINLDWLIDWYQSNKQYGKGAVFFQKYFYRLSGTHKLQQQIEAGMSSAAIKASWQEGLQQFKIKRKKYLRYP